MAKPSNRRFSIASPQHLRAMSRAPARISPNSSSRADGLWLGAPDRAITTDAMSAVGRFGRFMPRAAKYP